MPFGVIFDFTYRPTLWLSIIPALINVGILIYAYKTLQRNKVTILFMLFVTTLLFWQLQDSAVRIAATPVTAEFWNSVLNLIVLSTTFGIHFVLVYTKNKLADSTFFLAVVYGISLFWWAAIESEIYEIGSADLVSTQWGWIPGGPFPLPYVTWIAFLALMMLVFLSRYAIKKWPEKEERNSALLLGIGFAIPTVQGIVTQIIIPELGYQEIPVTSSFMSFFSLASIVALKKYDFLEIDPRTVFTQMGEGTIGVDKEGKIIEVNPAALEMLGRRGVEVVNKNFSEVITLKNEQHKQVPFKETPVWQSLTTGQVIYTTSEQVFYCVRKDGTVFPAALSVSPITSAEDIQGAVIVLHDITVEQELNKVKNEFISLAAHELQARPFVINWFVERLRTEAVSLTKEQKEYLANISEANQVMIQLVMELLTTSRLEGGVFFIQKKKVALTALVNDVVEKMKQLQNKKYITINRSFPDQPVIIETDPLKLRIVLHSLLDNAYKYSDEGDTIELRIELKDHSAILEVKDEGIGIPADEQRKIFTKLFRAKNAERRLPNGTGLGLYISKEVIERLGGAIWFTSTENKGTIFYVELPLD